MNFKFAKLLTLSATMSMAVLLVACDKQNSAPQLSGTAIPTQQEPQSFLPQEKADLLKNPNAPKTAILLSQNNLHSQAVAKLNAIGAKIKVTDAKSGIIIATMPSKAWLDFAQSNTDMGRDSMISQMGLDKLNKLELDRENINPFTGKRYDPSHLKLVNNSPFSPQLPVNDLGVEEFKKQMAQQYNIEANGDATTIAIVDTGVDISHADVFQDRVVVSRDFTGEGNLVLKEAQFDPATGTVSLDLKAIIPGAGEEKLTLKVSPETQKSIDGKYYLGLFSEQAYSSGDGISDFNQDGESNSLMAVLAYQASEGAVVSLDTNGNSTFEDDASIRDYSLSRQKLSVDPEGRVQVNFNLPLSDDGKLVLSAEGDLQIEMAGFDNGRHGTHVAGMAAGNFTAPQFKGSMTSAAPKAKIFGMKALGSGGGQDSNILNAVLTSAQLGADVINMSLGGLRRPTDGSDLIAKSIDRIARAYNVVFIISAGNSGPGLNQVGSPGSSLRAVTIGASVTSANYSSAFGIITPVDATYMWYFSSNGPLDDGRVKPTVVAPGSALSSVSRARSSNGPEIHSYYDVMQGTSMAAPAASGAVALLIDAVKKINKSQTKIASDNLSIEKALIDGAVDLNELNSKLDEKLRGAYHYSTLEQGAGILNLPKTFAVLSKRSVLPSTEYDVLTTNLRMGYGAQMARGVYATRPLPESIILNVIPQINPAAYPDKGKFYQGLKLTASQSWVVLRDAETGIIGDNITQIRVGFDRTAIRDLAPGIHHARIFARDIESNQLEFVFDVTYVKAKELNLANNSTLVDSAVTLQPGEMKRIFLQVNENISALNVDLRTLFIDGESKRNVPGVLMFVLDPLGRPVFESEKFLTGERAKEVFNTSKPMPGTWEVVLFKSPASKSTTPSQIRISTSQLMLADSRFLIAMGETPKSVSRSTMVTNYGAPVTLKLNGTVDTIMFQDGNLKLENKNTLEIPVEIPEGVSTGRVSTDAFKDNSDVEIDVDLVDQTGRSLAQPTFRNGVLAYEFAVRRGQKIKLVFKAYELGRPSLPMNVDWSFELAAKAPLNPRVSKNALAWGDSTPMAFSLDPALISMTPFESFKAQGKSISASGTINFVNTTEGGDNTVHSTPVIVTF